MEGQKLEHLALQCSGQIGTTLSAVLVQMLRDAQQCPAGGLSIHDGVGPRIHHRQRWSQQRNGIADGIGFVNGRRRRGVLGLSVAADVGQPSVARSASL